MFRFDASPAIGGGHAVRCGALAEELSRLGHVCGFAANSSGAALAASILPNADCLCVAGDDDLAQMKRQWPNGAEWLVVDHHDRDAAFERACKGWARHVLAVDDRPTRAHTADILLDQTLDRTEADYRELVNPDCKALTGTAYTLLRGEFRANRAAALARRAALPQSPRIVVSFGASDPGKATLRTLEGLRLLKHAVHIEILVGRLCPHLGEIEAAVKDEVRATMTVEPASVARHFAEADIGVGAPGMTAWERACLGLPAIVIPVADNQVDNAAALARHGAVAVLPPVARVTATEIASAVSSLLTEPLRWHAMAKAAATLVDGDGAKRVCRAMAA